MLCQNTHSRAKHNRAIDSFEVAGQLWLFVLHSMLCTHRATGDTNRKSNENKLDFLYPILLFGVGGIFISAFGIWIKYNRPSGASGTWYPLMAESTEIPLSSLLSFLVLSIAHQSPWSFIVEGMKQFFPFFLSLSFHPFSVQSELSLFFCWCFFPSSTRTIWIFWLLFLCCPTFLCLK